MFNENRENLFGRAASIIIVSAIVSCAAANVFADPTNYQRYIIGERALGMAGAQTAAVNDPMANLYNPAAMVFTDSTMVSASKCLYSFDSRKIDGGYIPQSSFASLGDEGAVDSLNLSHRNDLTLPSTLALSTRFGPRLFKDGPKRHAIGVAILVPNQDRFTYYGDWESNGAVRDRETYALSENYTQIWTGLSYALRVSRKLGLGVSAFMVNTSSTRNLNISRYGETGECSLTDCGFMEFRESHLDMTTVSLLFRLGALWEPHENWRFGLVMSAPTILLGDLKLYKTAGKLRQTFGVANVDGSDDDRVEYYSDAYNLDVATYEPMSFRVGGAFLWSDMFTVDLDVSLYLPISYRRIKGDVVMERRCPSGVDECEDDVDLTASPEWYDNGIIKNVEREAVVNLNVGWELIIDDTWTIRNGLFTDFSSAPRVEASEHEQQPRINRYGAGLSAGFKAKGYDISIGMTGSIGYGQTAIYNPHVDDNPWRPAATSEKALYIFIAGIQAAAVKGSKTIVKKTEKKIKEVLSKDDEGVEDAPEEPETEESETEATGGETSASAGIVFHG